MCIHLKPYEVLWLPVRSWIIRFSQLGLWTSFVIGLFGLVNWGSCSEHLLRFSSNLLWCPVPLEFQLPTINDEIGKEMTEYTGEVKYLGVVGVLKAKIAKHILLSKVNREVSPSNGMEYLPLILLHKSFYPPPWRLMMFFS